MGSENIVFFNSNYDLIRDLGLFIDNRGAPSSLNDNTWGHKQYSKEDFTAMAIRVNENICKVILGVAHLARLPSLGNSPLERGIMGRSVSQMVQDLVSIRKISVVSYGTDQVAITINKVAIEAVLYTFTHRDDFVGSRSYVNKIFHENDKLTIILMK